jgi:hypothetical protein
MVRLPCAPTGCEVVLVRTCQDRDGLNPGCRLDTQAGECLMCKSLYSACRTVSDEDATDGVLQYPSAGRAGVKPAPPAPRFAAAGLTPARRRECGIGAVDAAIFLCSRRQIAAQPDTVRQVKSRLLHLMSR